MASRQQYESPICGDCECRKPQSLPHVQGQIVSGFCKAYPHLNVGITCNKENLVPSDCRVMLVARNSIDPTQKWMIVEKKSDNDNDKNVFVLVNTSTGQALCAKGDEVVLTEYKVDNVDKSVLWSLSQDMGDGFKKLISTDGKLWTAEGCDQGIKIMLRTSNGQDNQLGKFLPSN